MTGELRPPETSRRSLLTTALAAFGALGAGVALAGCGGKGLQGTPEEIVRRAPGLTIGAGPWSLNLERSTVRAKGVVDFKGDRLQLAINEGGIEARRQYELVMIGGDVWTKTGAGPWERAPLDPNLPLSLPAAMRSGDVLAMVELPLGVEEAKVFGGQQVQSASTIRYISRNDPVVAAKGSGSAARKARLGDLPRKINHLTRLDVFVDPQGRIRRMDLEDDLISMTPTTRTDGARFVTTVELLEPGVTADIKPPI